MLLCLPVRLGVQTATAVCDDSGDRARNPHQQCHLACPDDAFHDLAPIVRPECHRSSMTTLSPVQRLTAHVRSVLGDGPFPLPGGWTHIGVVICDASFHARRKYTSTIKPRLLQLQSAWPDAATVRGFQARLATEDLAVAMNFNSPSRVATAHAITNLLVDRGVDTRDDLHAWLGHQGNRAALRAVKGVGSKSVDYIGNLVGRSHVAVDVHLRAFAADAGVTGLQYEELRAVYEEAAAALGHEPGGMEHAVWRFKSRVPSDPPPRPAAARRRPARSPGCSESSDRHGALDRGGRERRCGRVSGLLSPWRGPCRDAGRPGLARRRR